MKPPKFQLGVVDSAKPPQPAEHHKEPAKPINSVRNSKLSKTIDGAIERMKQASEAITSTKQELTADLFLQQQKQKRLEYARNLNEQFEKQRKMREKKLYKVPVEQNDPKKYLNQMPELRKYFKDSSEDDPFIFEDHSSDKLEEFVRQLSLAELRTSEEQIFARLEAGQPVNWERIERLAEDSTKCHFAELSKPGEVIMKSDLLPTEEAEQLANVLAIIGNSPQLYSRFGLDCEGKTYAFGMFKRGKPYTVVLDGFLQCEKFERNTLVKHSRCWNRNRFWLAIAEKAYKKMRYCSSKGLAQLNFQTVLNDLANIDGQVIKFSRQALILNNFFVSMHLLVRNRSVVALYRKGMMEGSCNSLEGMLYPIKQVRLFKDARNCRLEVLNPWRGKVLKADGSTELNVEELLQNFNRIVVVKSYPQDWCGVSLNSNFLSNGLPSSSSTDWTKNNQHLLIIAKPCCLRILMKPQQLIPSQFGFFLFRADPQDVKITTMNLERLVSNAKSSNPNSAANTLSLEKGSYFLVPYTHERSVDSYVFFRFEIYCNRNDSLIFGKSRYFESQYVNISKDADKMLVELQQTEVFEKPKTERILEPKSRVNRPLEDTVSLEQVKKMGLEHPRLEQFFYPGMLHQFIVKDTVTVQENPSQRDKGEVEPTNEQALYEQRNEIFKCLIGVDAYTEDVNRGLMEDATEMLDEQVDLAMFQLGDEGFQNLLQVITEQPIVRILNISSNNLHDESISYLCYYLEKTGHTELKQLNVCDNNLTDVSYRSLLALKQRLPCLEVIRADRNPGINREMLKSLSSATTSKGA